MHRVSLLIASSLIPGDLATLCAERSAAHLSSFLAISRRAAPVMTCALCTLSGLTSSRSARAGACLAAGTAGGSSDW